MALTWAWQEDNERFFWFLSFFGYGLPFTVCRSLITGHLLATDHRLLITVFITLPLPAASGSSQLCRAGTFRVPLVPHGTRACTCDGFHFEV